MPSDRSKTVFFCRGCGHESPKWMGFCPACGENTALEEAPSRATPSRQAWLSSDLTSQPQELSEVSPDGQQRMSLGLGELNRVLGGGMVPGSVVLMAGEPGIGKSTLLLQAAPASSL